MHTSGMNESEKSRIAYTFSIIDGDNGVCRGQLYEAFGRELPGSLRGFDDS